MAEKVSQTSEGSRGSWTKQYLSQLKKILLLRLRHKISTLVQFLLPVLLLLALAGIKTTAEVSKEEKRVFPNEVVSLPLIGELIEPLSGLGSSYGKDFIDHGGSNIAITCNLTDIFSDTGGVSPEERCQDLKWAIIPNRSDTLLINKSIAFENFLINRFAVNQSRFVSRSQISDTSSLEDYVRSKQYGTYSKPPIGLAVVFDSAGPEAWEYSIRVNSTASYGGGPPSNNVPPTNEFTEDTLRGNSSYSAQYITSGFLTMQRLVDTFIMEETNEVSLDLSINLYAMPTRAYSVDDFWDSAQQTFGLFLVLSMLYPLAIMIQQLTLEKEKKVKELMFVMSLRTSAYFGAWISYYTIFNLLLAIVLVGVSSVNLFTYSDLSVIFVYFLLFLLSSMSFSFFISSLFSRAKIAFIVGLLLFFTGYILFAALSAPTIPIGAKAIISLIPSAAFCFGTDSLRLLEGGLIGLQWTNIGYSVGNATPFSITLGMLIFDTVLYMLLALYFDTVLSGRAKWHFPFTCWKSLCKGSKNQSSYKVALEEEREFNERSLHDGGAFEPVPEALRTLQEQGKCVLISDLQKTYKSAKGPVNAVQGLSMTMYEGQITALLGANGAGKTTTIGMLTGMVPITGGTAFIGGKNCETEMADIRGSLGVCPQINILFDDLTVYEHLDLFARIKGVPYEKMKSECEQMILDLGLMKKRNEFTKNLSGGMKRKVQLAIALLGDSNFVLLDEPTSGMDPYSRRFTWQMIEKHRENRIIVLTTHFMDEADLLGDRIVMMADGKLSCAGSSLFLKNAFGVGYQLTIDVVEGADDTRNGENSDLLIEGVNKDSNLETTSNTGSRKAGETVESVVVSYVPDAKVVSRVGTELLMQLPLNASKSFEDMLKDLNENQVVLGVRNVGISVTTLESVFLRVSNYGLNDMDAPSSKTKNKNKGKSSDIEDIVLEVPETTSDSISWEKNDENKSFGRNFISLVTKRLLYAKRDRRALCCQILVPIIFLILGFIVLIIVPNQDEPMYVFTLKDYNAEEQLDTVVPFTVGNGESNSSIKTSEIMGNAKGTRLSIAESFNIGPTASDPGSADFINSSISYSNQLLETLESNAGSRYCAAQFDALPENVSSNIDISYTTVFNFTGLHAAPIMMNLLDSAIIRTYGNSTKVDIKTSSFPLPRTQSEVDVINSFSSFTATIAIGIAFSFVPASFAYFIVREKEERSWFQQLINGINPSAYWLSNWLFDFCSFLLIFFVAMILIAAVDVVVYRNNIGAVVLIFLLYGASVTSFTYCCTFIFSKASNAQIGCLFLNLLAGLILFLLSFIFYVIDNLYKINYGLMFIYRIFPTFSFAHGLLQISIIDIITFTENRRAGTFEKTFTVWDLEVAGLDILFLFLALIFYTILLIVLEVTNCHCSWRCCKAKAQTTFVYKNNQTKVIDNDVQAEAEMVHKPDADEANIALVRDLKKTYDNGKVAVNNLSLGIRKRECFCLLGVNGAGKTTTLSMLSGDFPPTSGDIFIGEHNMVQNPRAAQREFGYCPQFDALFGLMTGREQLYFYSRVKGIPENLVKNMVEHKIHELGLTKHADKLAGGYSGGNKRKLSVAIATLGLPKVIFLDEPSSGMDPSSRRQMWDVVAKIANSKDGASVILTTHSMEECEALASRIGIMVDGQFQCLGTAQHLKTKFGKGYELEVYLEIPTQEQMKQVAKLVGMEDLEGNVDSSASIDCVTKYKPELDLITEFQKENLGSAFVIQQQLLHGAGQVKLKSICEWIIAEESFKGIELFVKETFSGQLKERQGLRVIFQIPYNPDFPLAKMFGLVETNKQKLSISTYSLGQTTLESIFNDFARAQADLIVE